MRPLGLARSLPMVLVLAAVADELQSGVPMVAAPGLGGELGLGAGAALFGSLLAGPTVLSLVIEPWVLAWSDRADRPRAMAVAFAAMSGFSVLAALSPSGAALGVWIGLWGAACGIATGIAQGALAHGPEGAEVGMARWVRGAVLGDLVAPVIVYLCGGQWRVAMVVAALLPAVCAVLSWRAVLPPLHDEEEPDVPLRTALLAGIRDPALFLWSVAVAGCGFLDEVLLVLVGLRAAAEGTLGTWDMFGLLGGAAAGGFATEALLSRWPGRSLLAAASVASAGFLAGYLVNPGASAVWLFLLGFASAALYPLAQAQAYGRIPGRPGLVHALETPLSWLDAAVPLGIGVLVSRWGVEAGLGVLVLQPVLIGVALGSSRRGSVAA